MNSEEEEGRRKREKKEVEEKRVREAVPCLEESRETISLNCAMKLNSGRRKDQELELGVRAGEVLSTGVSRNGAF